MSSNLTVPQKCSKHLRNCHLIFGLKNAKTPVNTRVLAAASFCPAILAGAVRLELTARGFGATVGET